MTQELNNDIVKLKAELYDANAAIQQLQSQGQELSGFLTQIAQLLQIQPDENNIVKLDTIYKAVEALTAGGVETTDAKVE